MSILINAYVQLIETGKLVAFKHCHEKICLHDWQPGKTEIYLLSYRD